MDISIIKDIRESYNLNREEFAEKLDITVDTLNTWEYRTKKIPKRKIQYIEKIFSAFFNGDEISTISENHYSMVPFYDLKIFAGKLSFGNVDILPDNKKRLVPRKDDKGNYLVVRVSGHSMDDNTKRSISDSDEILIREFVDNLDSLPIYSKLFVIVTNNGILVKQILENKGETILCHSFNTKHEDFLINYSDILQVFTIENKVHSNIIF